MLKGFQLFSPFHWIRLVQPWVTALATQKRLLAYVVTEVVVDVGILFFYLVFHDVALTRRSWWVFYFTAAFLRIIGSCVGFVGLLWRSMKWTRVYYFIFCISTVGVVWTLFPIHRLRCACDNYTSCQSLSAFAPPGKPYLHGENPPTNYLSLISNSYIRVESAPKKTREITESHSALMLGSLVETSSAEEAGTLPSSEIIQEAAASLVSLASSEWVSVSAKATAAAEVRLTSQLQLESLAKADAELAEEEAAVQKERGAARRAVLYASSNNNNNNKSTSNSSFKGHQTGLRVEESAKRVLNWWRTRYIRKGQEVFDTGYLSNFWITPNNAQFDPRGSTIGDSRNAEPGGDSCMISPLRGSQVGILAIQSKLEDLRQSAWDQRETRPDLIDVRVIKTLRKCFADPGCSSLQISTHLRGKRDPVIAICFQMGLQRVFDRREERMDHDYMNTPFSLTLRRRNLVAITAVKQPLYNLKLNTGSSSEGLKRLYESAENACACSFQDGRNCRRDSDSGPQTKYWCYVDADDVEACLANKFRVFQDKAKKFFTYDLCTAPTSSQQCQCSGLGAYPPTTEKSFEHMLWPNKLNYGSSCADWNDNGHSWCYVGFDSTCADRKGRQRYTQEDTKNLFADVVAKPLQFKSQLPCLGEAQDEIEELATQRCWVFKVIAFTTIVAHLFFGRILAGCLLHAFIANRCTDPVTVESQFDVTFSDDEEFVAGGGPTEDAEAEDKENDAAR
mmetsp:Transcript_63707/g.134217  ORF Transcript_63707/g.134217 Transcript_63707/m.134217 type:complete len:734 (-) Transcript_63707:75-2276(-)